MTDYTPLIAGVITGLAGVGSGATVMWKYFTGRLDVANKEIARLHEQRFKEAREADARLQAERVACSELLARTVGAVGEVVHQCNLTIGAGR